eukprot:10858928-Lingulodinium_polyedra.AAC.1
MTSAGRLQGWRVQARAPCRARLVEDGGQPDGRRAQRGFGFGGVYALSFVGCLPLFAAGGARRAQTRCIWPGLC